MRMISWFEDEIRSFKSEVVYLFIESNHHFVPVSLPKIELFGVQRQIRIQLKWSFPYKAYI